ncbi:MAG: gas vesicle protein GvpG [Myxococcales bacterium]
MIVLDRMLVGGIKFVLGKIAAAADSELNDDSRLREELLAAQMRLELGEIDEEGFRALEADLLARLRAIRERQRGEALDPGEMKVTGVEATIHGEE